MDKIVITKNLFFYEFLRLPYLEIIFLKTTNKEKYFLISPSENILFQLFRFDELHKIIHKSSTRRSFSQ